MVAYNDPNIGSDLRQFDREYGLPNPPSFTKYVETGLTQSNPGWSLETALDVEWSHAMAPGANLVLVEASSASLANLFNAVNFARSLNGVVDVSMSWGTSEFYGETAYDSLFTTPAGHIGGDGLPGGVTFVAASGDSGAWDGVSYPAASPNVLSVGADVALSGRGLELCRGDWLDRQHGRFQCSRGGSGLPDQRPVRLGSGLRAAYCAGRRGRRRPRDGSVRLRLGSLCRQVWLVLRGGHQRHRPRSGRD